MSLMHPFPSCHTVTLYGEGSGKSIAGTRMFAAKAVAILPQICYDGDRLSHAAGKKVPN
jgi:hypothetical protein